MSLVAGEHSETKEQGTYREGSWIDLSFDFSGMGTPEILTFSAYNAFQIDELHRHNRNLVGTFC
ncbi:MAG: hypothetical protein MGF17_02640 [Trichodesmium sp. MAG_R04]|nr:hypothetical protein [Trichodesmium sp. MAG_R04]